MSASHLSSSSRALPRAALIAALVLLAGVFGSPGLSAALVRSPLTGEWVEELPPRPEPKPAPRSAFSPRSAVPGGLYGTDGANLYSINKATAAATLIGPHGIPPAEFGIGSLGFGADGELYGITTGFGAKLYRINTSTGAATAVGSGLGLGFTIEGGLDFICSAARAASDIDGMTGQSRVFTANTVTGAGTLVGPAAGNNSDLNGMAYDGTVLWAIDRMTNSIGKVDFATGVFKDPVHVKVGGVPIGIGNTGGLAADPVNGTIYAALGSTGGLYTLNPVNGAATLIGTNNVTFGLAFAPLAATPTPPPTPTPTPSPTPPAQLDHFMFYRSKTTSGTPALPFFGPVTLTDAFGAFSYEVKQVRRLGLPANRSGLGINDPVTHLTEYQIRPTRGAGKFQGLNNILVTDPFGTRSVKVKKADSLLVPTNKSFTSFPAKPTTASSNVDHFVCYKVKGIPRADFAVVQDQFENRSYTLKRITRICNPVAKSGSPKITKGPGLGSNFPIAPSTIRNYRRLLCYKAVGVDGRHVKRNGLYLNNQFGQQRVDTVREQEFCLPASGFGPTPQPTPTPTPGPSPTPTPPGPCRTPSPTPPIYGSAVKAFLESTGGLFD